MLSTEMLSESLQVAALGQPFTLGMLYDARKDSLVSAPPLWDRKTVEANTTESLQDSSAFDISASDSTQSKSSLLDIDASVKASFLGGLIEVGGSAKYLTDQKKFMNQSRVTFQYKATTSFKQLSMTHLNIDEDLLGRSSATHVVTGILYGANAFFVFDSEKLDSSNVQKIHGSMEAVIKKIPTFNVEGKAEIKLTDEEKNLVQTFSCTFHGDFILESNPTTFVDAVKTYVELPKLLKSQANCLVPMKVWLLPLTALAPSPPKLCSGISIGLVRKIEETLDDVKKMESRCNDSLVDITINKFPQIREDLRQFQKLCHRYTSYLQQALEKKLPSIREGQEDESALRQLFDSRATSPFSHEKLLKWLEGKEREINIIRCSVEILKDITIVNNQSELDRHVLSPDIKQALCFIFTSLETADPSLVAMAHYFELLSTLNNEAPWYYSEKVFNRIREKAKTFHNLFEKNKSDKTFCFLVASIPNETYTGATIYYYKDGILITEDYSKLESETAINAQLPPIEVSDEVVDVATMFHNLPPELSWTGTLEDQPPS